MHVIMLHHHSSATSVAPDPDTYPDIELLHSPCAPLDA